MLCPLHWPEPRQCPLCLRVSLINHFVYNHNLAADEFEVTEAYHEAPDVRVVPHGHREAAVLVGGGGGVEGGVASSAEPRFLGTLFASFEVRGKLWLYFQ